MVTLMAVMSLHCTDSNEATSTGNAFSSVGTPPPSRVCLHLLEGLWERDLTGDKEAEEEEEDDEEEDEEEEEEDEEDEDEEEDEEDGKKREHRSSITTTSSSSSSCCFSSFCSSS